MGSRLVFSGDVTDAATAALDALLDRLRDGGLEHEGLFRIPGNAEDVADARKQLDAGDDPDITHGALAKARLRPGPSGSGLRFESGEGVGTVTKPGLPIAVGEPSISPGPREQITAALQARTL